MAGINQYRTKTLLMVGNGRSTEFFPRRHAKHAILRHADPVPNVQNHVTFRTHFTSSILSSFIILLILCLHFFVHISSTFALMKNSNRRQAISSSTPCLLYIFLQITWNPPMDYSPDIWNINTKAKSRSSNH